MKTIIQIIIYLSFLFSQQTIFESLPFSDNINNIIVNNLDQDISILNNNLISEDFLYDFDSKYNLYEIKYSLDVKNKFRIILTVNSFPKNGKLFISNSKNEFQGPIFYNQIDNNKIVSGTINDDIIIIKYLQPKNQLQPQIIIDYIITEDQYIVENQLSFKKHNHFYKHTIRDNPVILVTGYWPPTNEMIRHFSQNFNLNPNGWEGENWENRGYDIISFFPEFDPPDCSNCGMGYGDLEVDYQYTTEDYWPIVNNSKPLGIITFSRGFNNMSWELEMNTYNRTNWINDYLSPYQPIPNPPDEESPINYHRVTALPIDQIKDAVNELDNGLDAYIDYEGHAGAFLSEFMGFHGIWYKDLHQYDDIDPCFSAGHIHVGGQVPINIAKQGTEESIRVLINYLNQFIYVPGDVNSDDLIDILDIILIVNSIMGIIELTPLQFLCADLNENGLINVLDIIQLVNLILES